MYKCSPKTSRNVGRRLKECSESTPFSDSPTLYRLIRHSADNALNTGCYDTSNPVGATNDVCTASSFQSLGEEMRRVMSKIYATYLSGDGNHFNYVALYPLLLPLHSSLLHSFLSTQVYSTPSSQLKSTPSNILHYFLSTQVYSTPSSQLKSTPSLIYSTPSSPLKSTPFLPFRSMLQSLFSSHHPLFTITSPQILSYLNLIHTPRSTPNTVQADD